MNKIVTISREFGSGGRGLGRRLAEKLNFAYYDHEIIAECQRGCAGRCWCNRAVYRGSHSGGCVQDRCYGAVLCKL